MEDNELVPGSGQATRSISQAIGSIGRRSGTGRCSAGSGEEIGERFMSRTLALWVVLFGGLAGAAAQPPNARIGEGVPRDVREMYDKGLQFLVKTQSEKGDWTGGQQGPGVTGMALMVFLASGEDPNFGM